MEWSKGILLVESETQQRRIFSSLTRFKNEVSSVNIAQCIFHLSFFWRKESKFGMCGNFGQQILTAVNILSLLSVEKHQTMRK